ncbi:hypothetical protein CTI92_12425 [Staphylococcus epidermidis]|nr:hypothetical protein CTI92_12425 [Staphylococcus epidermidis]
MANSEKNRVYGILQLETLFKEIDSIFNTIKEEYGMSKEEILILLTQSSPDSCVKCYTMFLPFLLIKIDVFS